MAYTKLTGDPKKGAVPPGEYNVLESLMATYEALVGYTVEPTTKELLAMANAHVLSQEDFGRFMSTQANGKKAGATMPWATVGLTKDSYVAQASSYGSVYKAVTGQDISAAALQQAFLNSKDPTGGLLTEAQYKQQLMNNANIQKAYGWVKYGLDFTAWTQQKLTLQGTFGHTIKDSEAATILQYTKAATGSTATAQAQRPQTQTASGVGVGQSATR